MKNQVKKMSKDALALGVAGVGLGVMGGVGGASSIGVLGKGLGTAGSLVMVGHGMKILQDVVPKKKKKGGWY